MPTLAADEVKRIGEALLLAAGALPDEAETVARQCTAANLAGHDSHGILQIPGYIDRMKRSEIVPGAPWQIVRESATTAVIDGNWGFGYVVTERAMRLAIEKAESANVAAVTVFRQSHIGRLAVYPLMAARAGMIGLITADSGRSPKAVAPFGGREPRLGTNPICFAVPSDLEAPLYLDMATSAVALSKVTLAMARGQSIPAGWIIDRDGNSTTDPSQIRKGGALLPLGAGEGYKGSGLGAIVEILCGLLTGLGFGVEPSGRHNDGCFMAAFKVDAFRPLAEFKAEVASFAHYLKDTPPAAGSPGVFYPGEIEYAREKERRQRGIPIDDATWAQLRKHADAFGIAQKLGFG